MTSVLITGAHGQVGSELAAAAHARGWAVTALGSADLDITDAAAVDAAVTAFSQDSASDPDTGARNRAVIINAAAHTAVDLAETDQERAYAVNERGPGLLAAAASRHDVHLVHLSTDYVFPGSADRPYEPTDATGPRSVYGASKLAGERAAHAADPSAVVVRTAWVWGATGGNFVKTMAALERSRPTVDVVDDQRGTPSYAADLAAGLLELADSAWLADPAASGRVLHLTNAGETTWFGFARAIFAALGADPERVRPTTSAAFVRPAPRPAYSVLSGQAWAAAGLAPLRPWDEALAAGIADHPGAFAG